MMSPQSQPDQAVQPAIIVDNVHEIFKVYAEARPGLRERLSSFKRHAYTNYHALNGVNVTIMPGERVGLVGHNGSGKSTLLKVIARILPPDKGTVTINGRMATLLELGAGFSPELTGRENMYLNGSILGLTREEVSKSFDNIVDFAGVRDFIDMPVKNYSSGMYVRLGFAIAVHVNPDILLVDEVLAVGDQHFQERSLSRMRAFAEAGKTVVLVSHDLGSIQNLCDRVIVLEHGNIVFDGPSQQGIAEYIRRIAEGKGSDLSVPTLPELSAHEVEDGEQGDGAVVITDISVAQVKPENAPVYVDPRPKPVQEEFPYDIPKPKIAIPGIPGAPGASGKVVSETTSSSSAETATEKEATDSAGILSDVTGSSSTEDTLQTTSMASAEKTSDEANLSSTETTLENLPSGTPVTLRIACKVTDDAVLQTGLYVRLAIRRTDIPTALYDSRTSWQTIYIAAPPKDAEFNVDATFTLHVLSGTFVVDVYVGNSTTDALHASVKEAVRIGIVAPPWESGIVPMTMQFAVSNPEGVWPPESVPPTIEQGGPSQHPSPLWPHA